MSSKATSKTVLDKLPTHEDDAFLTQSEVARQLGKHISTIGRWIQDGLLIAVRSPSGLPVLRQSEVNKFLGGSALTTRVEKQNGEANSNRGGTGNQPD